MTQKIYPFDLERALKGEAVITRDGREVLCISQTTTCLKLFAICGMIGSKTHYWGLKGNYLSATPDSIDLFMLTPPTDDSNA